MTTSRILARYLTFGDVGPQTMEEGRQLAQAARERGEVHRGRAWIIIVPALLAGTLGLLAELVAHFLLQNSPRYITDSLAQWAGYPPLDSCETVVAKVPGDLCLQAMPKEACPHCAIMRAALENDRQPAHSD